MPDLSMVVAKHLNETLSLGDFFAALRRSRRLRPLLLDSFIESYLVGRARQAGITVSEEELQKASDNFRVKNGMASAEQTQQWFLREALTPDDFAVGLERDLLVEKLRSAVSDNRVNEAFNAQTARFARVRLRRILVATETEARDIVNLVGAGQSFEALARDRSLDLVTKSTGGDGGIVRRVDLAPPIGDAVFSAEVNKLVGPINAGQGFLVLQVLEFLPAVMDEGIQTGLKKEIFDTWLRNELSKGPIDFPLFELLNGPNA
jgi:foldase protein PrsA